jgi:hypothetical protein
LQHQIANEFPCFWSYILKGVCVEQKHLSSTKLEHWAEFLQAHNLVDLTTVLLDSAGVWGFVGGQIMWMLTPFFGESKLGQLAELLEDPEALQELRDYLVM